MYMEHIDLNIFNSWAKSHITDENKFDSNGHIIMENNHNYKSTGIFAKILEDHWSEYYSKYHVTIDSKRSNANEEVKKVIKCANHELGATVYVCPNCDEVFYCHHTCKGKLCSSCGIKTQKIRTENILRKCINCTHRHITFTIPDSLCPWFFDDLTTTNILFEAVSDTIYSIVNGRINKKKKTRKQDMKYAPGYMAFLHTFGRPLNFNTHIHVIIAEYIIDKSKRLKKFKYFNYNALSKRFMYFLLNRMEKYFGKKFTKVKNEMYLKYKNGFYVNNKLEDDGYQFSSIEKLIKYLVRYCSRPAMAESRILNYDGKNVSYFYLDHKENIRHEETVSAFEFITKILRHLLPTNFKSIRSYGFYNKPSKLPLDIHNLISKAKLKIRNELLKWSLLISKSFNRIPIMCPKCGILMEPLFEVSR